MNRTTEVKTGEYIFVDRFVNPELQIVIPFGRLADSTDASTLYDLLVKYNGNHWSLNYSLSTRVPLDVMQRKFDLLKRPFENGAISQVYVKFSQQRSLGGEK